MKLVYLAQGRHNLLIERYLNFQYSDTEHSVNKNVRRLAIQYGLEPQVLQ